MDLEHGGAAGRDQSDIGHGPNTQTDEFVGAEPGMDANSWASQQVSFTKRDGSVAGGDIQGRAALAFVLSARISMVFTRVSILGRSKSTWSRPLSIDAPRRG